MKVFTSNILLWILGQVKGQGSDLDRNGEVIIWILFWVRLKVLGSDLDKDVLLVGRVLN